MVPQSQEAIRDQDDDVGRVRHLPGFRIYADRLLRPGNRVFVIFEHECSAQTFQGYSDLVLFFKIL